MNLDVDPHTSPEAPMPGLFVDVTQVENGLRVVVGGEVDLATAPTLAAALADAFERTDRVELDLSLVRFMDSQGLGVLVQARPDEASNRRLVVVDGSRAVRRLLAVTGLNDVFELPIDLR